METPVYLTTIEAAAFLRVAPQTMRVWRWAGRGPQFTKCGSRCLYERTGLVDWLRAHTFTSTAEADAAKRAAA